MSISNIDSARHLIFFKQHQPDHRVAEQGFLSRFSLRLISCHYRHAIELTFPIQDPSKAVTVRAGLRNHTWQLCVFSLSFAIVDYTVCILDYSYRCLVAMGIGHLFRRIMMRFTAIVTDVNDKYGTPRFCHISSQPKTLRPASDAHPPRSLKHVRGVLCDEMSLSKCYHTSKLSNTTPTTSRFQMRRSSKAASISKPGLDDVNPQDTSRFILQLNRFVLFLNNNQALAFSPPSHHRYAKPSKTGVEKI